MSDEDIIKTWCSGLDKFQTANEYMRKYNKEVESKKRQEKDLKKINKNQALKHVEPILYNYQMRVLKGVI